MNAGDFVLTAASLLGPGALAVVHEDRPQLGTVESLTPGAPPTAVTVVWADGKRTLYAVVGSGATSVLYRFSGIASALLIGLVAQPKSASGIPNPGGRLRGPVVAQYSLFDPNDVAVPGEVVVVETPAGFLVTQIANIEVVPSA